MGLLEGGHRGRLRPLLFARTSRLAPGTASARRLGPMNTASGRTGPGQQRAEEERVPSPGPVSRGHRTCLAAL